MASEMKQITDVLATSIHIFPYLFSGHVLAHSWEHFLGLHLSGLTIAILILPSPDELFLSTISFLFNN